MGTAEPRPGVIPQEAHAGLEPSEVVKHVRHPQLGLRLHHADAHDDHRLPAGSGSSCGVAPTSSRSRAPDCIGPKGWTPVPELRDGGRGAQDGKASEPGLADAPRHRLLGLPPAYDP